MHVARRRDEGLADAPAFGRADRDVLQVGVVARQPPRHRHRLRVVRVHAAGARMRHLRAACRCRCPSAWTGRGAPAAWPAADSPRPASPALPRRCSARRSAVFFTTGRPSLAKRISPICLGLPRLKGWPASSCASLFQLHDALAQLVALLRQQRRVDQHAVALDAVQRLAALHLQVVDEAQLRVAPRSLGHSARCTSSVWSESSQEYSAALSIGTWLNGIWCAPLPRDGLRSRCRCGPGGARPGWPGRAACALRARSFAAWCRARSPAPRCRGWRTRGGRT